MEKEEAVDKEIKERAFRRQDEVSMARKSNKALFDELEAWSRRKNLFSVNEFLKEKEISLDEFE